MSFYPYDIDANGQTLTGITDARGRTQLIFTDAPQTIIGTPQENNQAEPFAARHIASGKRVQLNFNES